MFNITVTRTGVYQLASRFQDTGPGGWRIDLTETGTMSCVLKQNLNAPGTTPTASNLTNVAYYDSNGDLVSAGTAITASGYVTVDAVNADLWVAVTLTGGGSQAYITRQMSPVVGDEPGEGYLPTNDPTFTGTMTGPEYVGDLTGNVTGDVTGNVTGNVTGSASLNVLTSSWTADRLFSSAGLGIGSNDVAVASIAFTYQVGAASGTPNTFKSKAAVTAGTALASGTVPADKWGLWLYSINGTGTIACTAAAANTTGYASEAAAKAAIPATPANQAPMGYATVLTASGQPFVPGTDALQGGSSGNPATTTNYYNAGLP